MTMARNPAASVEPDLVERARRGDRIAYAALVDHFWDRLYRWLYRLTHDAHTAEDLTQDTFLKAFTALPSFKDGHLQSWLFRIAYNSFLNLQRPKNKVRQSLPEEFAAADPGPDEQILSREALQHLARAVGRLPGDYRAAFLLRVEEDLSFKDIAEVLSITVETARWRVFKARQKLMEVLEPYFADDAS
jgi:RNA polymerase sigma-70 factor (ECF subfamily)